MKTTSEKLERKILAIALRVFRNFRNGKVKVGMFKDLYRDLENIKGIKK